MSEKNFVAYGDAESILTGYANRIKQSPTTFVGTQAQWNALSSSQKAEYELVDITDDSLSPSGQVDWESNGEIGAKNLLPFDISHIIRINGGGTWNGLAYTYNGVTYTLLSDGTVRVNGTATAYSLFRIIDANSIFLNPSNDYYITGSPSSSTASTYYVYYSELINGSWVYYSNLGDEDTLFTPNITATQCVVDIVVRDGQIADNVIFKPMLRLATDPDTTYQPYAMTNKELTKQVAPIDDMNNILGAKNLLPVTMATQVLSGVTFTVDASSGVISVSGSNSGNPFSDVLGITTLTPGTYKVTTGQTPELNAQIGIAITDASSGTIIARSWNGTEVFTISSNTQVRFHIEVNVTGAITSTSIYPMCRPLSIKDEKYVPYAPTNRALTLQVSSFEEKFNTKVNMTVQPNTTYFNAASSQSCGALKIGYLVVMNLVLSVKDNVTVPANTLACTITNVGAISANSSIFIGGNGASNITRLVLRRNGSNDNNLDVFFIDSYSNSSMRASLVFMVNTIV